jgi:hypothetical protein
MIKQALAQGDIPYLNKLFDTYIILKDEKELIKVGIKIIQKADKLNNKDRLIYIMDNIYDIISKQRKVLRNITVQEVQEAKYENKKKIKHLRELKDHFSKLLADTIKKILKEVKKGVSTVVNHSVSKFNICKNCKFFLERDGNISNPNYGRLLPLFMRSNKQSHNEGRKHKRGRSHLQTVLHLSRGIKFKLY